MKKDTSGIQLTAAEKALKKELIAKGIPASAVESFLKSSNTPEGRAAFAQFVRSSAAPSISAAATPGPAVAVAPSVNPTISTIIPKSAGGWDAPAVGGGGDVFASTVTSPRLDEGVRLPNRAAAIRKAQAVADPVTAAITGGLTSSAPESAAVDPAGFTPVGGAGTAAGAAGAAAKEGLLTKILTGLGLKLPPGKTVRDQLEGIYKPISKATGKAGWNAGKMLSHGLVGFLLYELLSRAGGMATEAIVDPNRVAEAQLRGQALVDRAGKPSPQALIDQIMLPQDVQAAQMSNQAAMQAGVAPQEMGWR